jgi:very-short-patch-repair endonuclease
MATFDSHPKSKFWSDKNILKPNEVALNSHKKFWFDCECGHEFESSLLNINQANNWCGFCSNPQKKLCDCSLCFDKSFASHPKSSCWLDENGIKPNKVFKCADRRRFKFKCDKCHHKFEMNLKDITMKGHWCSYCSHQKLCDNKDCNMCFNNSFASIERSKYLNDKNINPRMLFKSTNKKFNFDCDICNKTFPSPLSAVTNGIWCSFCVNKTELILYNVLKEYYSMLKSQYKVEWCKNIKHLPFDFVIEERKIIIELDGNHHIKQVSNWNSPEETRKRDLYKMKCANENGFSVIRILQEDVYKNKYEWLTELCENIQTITNENRVQNIYMCKNNEYKDFDIS